MAKGEDLQAVGRAVAARRGDLRMTQQDLADAARVDLKTVYNLESGTRWPIARTRSAIAAALGWEPEALNVIATGGGQPARAAPALTAVPSPPASLEPGPGDVFPDVEAEMRPLIDAHLQTLRHLYRLAAIRGPVTSGSAIFTDTPHEAERWDRLVATGYMEKPGEGYTVPELLFLMATGRVFDDQYRAAAGQPDRRRKALIRVT